jgi:hypothetical protein
MHPKAYKKKLVTRREKRRKSGRFGDRHRRGWHKKLLPYLVRDADGKLHYRDHLAAKVKPP